MSKATDSQVVGVSLYFIPIQTRMPLKFGSETLTSVTCARASVTLANARGQTFVGWGETPLSVQWVWPGLLPYEHRHRALKDFCGKLTEAWAGCGLQGHPMEIGHDFQEQLLPGVLGNFHRDQGVEPMPWLAALVCCSPFDLALHDAYGRLVGRPVYETYRAEFMNRDLAAYLRPAPDAAVTFTGKYPEDYFVARPPERLRAWHLVGGLDPLHAEELDGHEPRDGYPVLLEDWIRRDGLTCLKVKLRGNDAAWDYARLLDVGGLAITHEAEWLTADFNCTVQHPDYVNELLDRLRDEEPRIYGMILYVEQPFPYELERHRIDVHSVSARKPLFLDESAHDWRIVQKGRELGWTGVALKTCKTQTGVLLTACWAKAHGMTLMVQDLTNPMLAQVPHVQLAARVGTIMGVESNAMQFYPEASRPEAEVHPGLYQRREGCLDLGTVKGTGFGYAGAESKRELPAPSARFPGTK